MNPRPTGPGSAAAVVVSYNAESHLAACLQSIAAGGVDDVVVVDNGSVDGSSALAGAAGARWVETGSNLGYGRAANYGVRALSSEPAASAQYLLICNPDLVVGTGAIEALLKVLDADPSLGAVGPRISNPNGSLYPSARSFPDLLDAMGHGLLGLVAPRNRFSRRYRLLDWDHEDGVNVDWVSGACFLIRREAWDDVGGFDPAYFMYMEDVDLCWRLRRAGWGVRYEPTAEVLHVQGVSAEMHPYRMLAAHHVSMWRFAWRTTAGVGRAALPVVAFGLLGRFVVVAAHRRFLGTTGGSSPGPLP